jgi:hypothetical protein
MLLCMFVLSICALFLTERLGNQMLRPIYKSLVTSKRANGNIN